MKLFGGVVSVTGMAFFIFAVFIIICLGYLLGRITVKGISLGTAGVFIVALLFGGFFGPQLQAIVTQSVDGTAVDISANALKILETLGLILFVGSVGLIAGPNFFANFKKNFKSYIVLGAVIIVSGAATCAACFGIGIRAEEAAGRTPGQFISMLVGLMSGSLTSTPAFSAAKETAGADLESFVTVGYGIAYLFGVIGVVLFVQLLPKIVKADMAEEVKKIQVVDTSGKVRKTGKFELDEYGFCAFAFTAIVGVFVGAIKIPLSANGLNGVTFSLTSTGGVLLVGLIVGHFGHFGPINMTINKKVLAQLRELGLVFFLIGAGVAGGMKFTQYFKPIYFLYGVAMTIVPMIIGFLFAKYVLKLQLLNALGSITGGMTSTPALGTLINTAGTEDVASAYAATYPVALILVVLASQFLITIFS